MHPVTSELDLAIRRYEQQLDFKALQRAQLASDAARLSGQSGPIARLVKSVRQFLDPRGFALAQALRIGPAPDSSGATRTASRSTIVTALPASPEAEASWRKAA